MKFTEREMTVAVDVVGKTLYAAKRPPWKRGSTDADCVLPPDHVACHLRQRRPLGLDDDFRIAGAGEAVRRQDRHDGG